MPDFMIGSKPFILFRDHPAFLFFAQGQLILCFLKFLHADIAFVLRGRDQRRFINQIGQIGTAESGSSSGDQFQIYVICQGHFGRMHLQNLRPSFDIRQIHRYLTIEASGTQQRRIQNIGTIGSRNDDHCLIGLKAIHLH